MSQEMGEDVDWTNHVRMLMQQLRETWDADPSDPKIGEMIAGLEETLLPAGGFLSRFDLLMEAQRSKARPVPTGAYSLSTLKKID